jgi:hypothetical protein
VAVRDERGPRPEPTEFIKVVELSFEEAMEGIRAGTITDAGTVLGLLWGVCGGVATRSTLHWEQ